MLVQLNQGEYEEPSSATTKINSSKLSNCAIAVGHSHRPHFGGDRLCLFAAIATANASLVDADCPSSHQPDFSARQLKNDTCTAKIIDPPTHRFLENTLPAIREAFRQGADMVEIDIHPTIDNQLAVFHDWTLECRTNGRGVTHEQSMTALKKLDIGYGYTADGGKTYPFRGMGVGLMPTFDEVIQAFPNQKILVDQKDTFEKTVRLLAHSLENYPTSQRENIYLFSGEDQYELLKRDIPEVKKIFPTRQEAKACVTEYLTMIVSGVISPACGKYALGIPVKYLKYIPGWPSFFFIASTPSKSGDIRD